mgnify:CR=1 FL=1|tara:strand:- start:2996 stop:3238 length:243 start_codon:yes stop_codon:yes gene_type:complete
MKPVRLTPTQIRRFLALTFVFCQMGKDETLILNNEVERELVATKMIKPNGGLPHITERGQKEIARLCAMGGVTIPWDQKT